MSVKIAGRLPHSTGPAAATSSAATPSANGRMWRQRTNASAKGARRLLLSEAPICIDRIDNMASAAPVPPDLLQNTADDGDVLPNRNGKDIQDPDSFSPAPVNRQEHCRCIHGVAPKASHLMANSNTQSSAVQTLHENSLRAQYYAPDVKC